MPARGAVRRLPAMLPTESERLLRLCAAANIAAKRRCLRLVTDENLDLFAKRPDQEKRPDEDGGKEGHRHYAHQDVRNGDSPQLSTHY